MPLLLLFSWSYRGTFVRFSWAEQRDKFAVSRVRVPPSRLQVLLGVVEALGMDQALIFCRCGSGSHIHDNRRTMVHSSVQSNLVHLFRGFEADLHGNGKLRLVSSNSVSEFW